MKSDDFTAYLKAVLCCPPIKKPEYKNTRRLLPDPEGWIETLDGWFEFELCTRFENCGPGGGYGYNPTGETTTAYREIEFKRSVIKCGPFKELPESATPNPEWIGTRKRNVSRY